MAPEQEPRSEQSQQHPRSERSQQEGPDTDALAVDALPDEVRLHGEPDETEQTQTSTAGPEPEPDDYEERS